MARFWPVALVVVLGLVLEQSCAPHGPGMGILEITVMGRVVDDRTGTPVAGAEVLLFGPGDDNPEHMALVLGSWSPELDSMPFPFVHPVPTRTTTDGVFARGIGTSWCSDVSSRSPLPKYGNLDSVRIAADGYEPVKLGPPYGSWRPNESGSGGTVDVGTARLKRR